MNENNEDDQYSPVCKPIEKLKDVLSWERGLDDFTVSKIPRCLVQQDKKGLPKTIVCHDMKGGYLDDRFIQGSTSSDAYRFYHWQYIDIFIYFSHNLVTIPPPCWTNSAHRHGVKVLGTVITEWNDGFECCNKLLENDVYKKFAAQLVNIAEYYKFDGWLINIENKIQAEKVSILKDFIEYLTNLMHETVTESVVIWYDSVTEDGDLKWQDELNSKNRIFFDVCDGIYLNYNITVEKLKQSKDIAVECNKQYDVYVGVDIFGRGTPGNGGYNTRQALSMIRQHNHSTALFAPGWVYETQGVENFTQNENRFWREIYDLCPSNKITTLPLATTFCQGYGKKYFLQGSEVSNSPWNNLSLQQLQPYLPLSISNNDKMCDEIKVDVKVDLSYLGGTSICIHGEISPNIHPYQLRLFETEINLQGLKINFVSKENGESVENMNLCLHLFDKQKNLQKIIYLISSLSSQLTTDSSHHIITPDIIIDKNGWTSRLYTVQDNLVKNCTLKQVNLLFGTQKVRNIEFYLGQLQILPIDYVKPDSVISNITSQLLNKTSTKLVYQIEWYCDQDKLIDYYNIYCDEILYGQTNLQKYILSLPLNSSRNLAIQPIYYSGEVTPISHATVYQIT